MSEPLSPAAVLAERARSAEVEPWLFHRDGWDWCWRSWGQVADHVARCVEVLGALETGASSSKRSESPRAGFADRQHPDAVTVSLALQAAGWVAVPVRGGREAVEQFGVDAWVEVGDASSVIEDKVARVGLPQALSPLDRTPLKPLRLERAPGSICGREGGEHAPGEWLQAAKRLDGSLAGGPERGGRGRPIVCATPELDLYATRWLEAWTLVRNAVWVMEPQASAFVETVLWARPTVVWGRAHELERLAVRLRVGKHRRRSRLRCVVAAGDEAVDPAPWQALGIELTVLREA